MSEPVALITNEVIEPGEFRAFLQQEGATLAPDNSFDGRISAGDKHVWIALDNSSLRYYDEDEELADELRTLTELLGDKPRTNIVLEISRTEGSEQLAINFACEFAKRWKCVVDDLRGKIYSSKELLSMQRAGRSFTDAHRFEPAMSDAT